ncbi:NAD(P)-binding protein [Streptomyces anulatus]|uniref:NAD(P)-binding protein n=1 Tax=Streptomyces anulatus TaxID=1892 RepID=UPI003632A9BE
MTPTGATHDAGGFTADGFDADVIVVGAGLAGLAVASTPAERFRVLVVDARPSAGEVGEGRTFLTARQLLCAALGARVGSERAGLPPVFLSLCGDVLLTPRRLLCGAVARDRCPGADCSGGVSAVLALLWAAGGCGGRAAPCLCQCRSHVPVQFGRQSSAPGRGHEGFRDEAGWLSSRELGIWLSLCGEGTLSNRLGMGVQAG